jgi:hypothetical protein
VQSKLFASDLGNVNRYLRKRKCRISYDECNDAQRKLETPGFHIPPLKRSKAAAGSEAAPSAHPA